jgi:paraquat-inducible protein B
MQSAQAALSQVEQTLGQDSVVRAELSGAFRELTSAARSVRVLMELLERQPDALLRGRGTAGGGK